MTAVAEVGRILLLLLLAGTAISIPLLWFAGLL